MEESLWHKHVSCWFLAIQEWSGYNVHSATAIHALGQLLGTVVLVEEVVGDLLQIGEVAVQQC
jgi:hypothetical protein